MASVACQGLQPCLEPRLLEPVFMIHNLSPPKSQSYPWPQRQNPMPDSEDHSSKAKNNGVNKEEGNSKNDKQAGWSFLKALTTPTLASKENVSSQETGDVYVHPMVKRSASTLSTKSLEMCTESLGSETGSDISSDEFPSLSWENERIQAFQRSKSEKFSRKMTNEKGGGSSFPPPLTSIGGGSGVRVRPHREGGRLVMKAETLSSTGTYFKAERTDGRLRLLLKDTCDENDSEDAIEEEEEEFGEDVSENEDEEEEEEYWGWDMEGNWKKVGDENEVSSSSSRPSRCKESGTGGNKQMADWGSYWVAIS